MTEIHPNSLVFYCPFCGNKYDINKGDDIDYCLHAQFAYIDPDFFAYVTPNFAKSYLKQIKEGEDYKQYLAENEIEVSKKDEEAFMSFSFKPGDEISQKIPYFESSAISVCSSNTIIFKLETTYSGFTFAIDGDLPEEQK